MAGNAGLDSATAALTLAALNGGTALSITGPLKVLFLSAIRTANNGTDTEWTASGSSYVPGTGFSGITFAAASQTATGATQLSSNAATITNAPALNWAGCRIVDSAGTPKTTFYAPVTPNKTVNLGDTVTVPAGSFTTTLG